MTAETIELEFFQDLSIHGTPEQLDAAKARILQMIAPGWSRTPDERINRVVGNDDVIALERAPDELAPAAGLYMRRSNGAYEVTNIVPKESGELGRRRYNMILQEFSSQIATPALVGTGATLELTRPTHSLEDSFGSQAAQALRRFSSAANMSTGSSHPNDRNRWYGFILMVRDQPVDDGTLSRWLMALGWPEDAAHRLTSEFVFGHGLLQYDREHG